MRQSQSGVIPGLLAVVAMVAMPGTASAVERDLLDEANLRIDGQAAGDQSGFPVAEAGDVNGDGRDDFVTGALTADNNGRSNSGSSYVIYGGTSGGTIDLATPLTPSQGFRIDGAAASDQSGYSVEGAADVNGDGRDDVIVGSLGADNNGRGSSGSSYVIYGAVSSANVDLAALPPGRGFRIDGAAAGDQSGFDVSGAGDVNGDGLGDVLVGALTADNGGRNGSGSSYVIYGAASGVNIDLATLGPAQGFRIDGAAASDQSGAHLSEAGDVNGDGRDDVILGASLADNNSRADSGSSYVIYGAATNVNIDLATLGAAQGFRIDGAAAADQSGNSVSEAGDFNGDGRHDVIVGAVQADNNGRGDSGSAYVIYGAATNSDVDLATLGSRGFRIDGAAANDRSAEYVTEAGDVNGDGRDDIAVGAEGADNNGRTNSGSAYAIYGTANTSDLDLSTLETARGFRIDGATAADNAGVVSGAGDFSGDGRDDLLVGAFNADNNARASSGSAYVVNSTFLPRLDYRETEAGEVGQPLTAAPTESDFTGTPSFSVSPPLPAGLTLNAATGAITGTPTASGVSSHEVTLADALGITSDRVTLDIDNAAGPAGPAGGTGAAGAPGAPGATGPQGPAGPAGRDATVTCKVGKPKKGKKPKVKVKVTCKVVLAQSASAVSQRATLSRDGEVVARASRSGPGKLRFNEGKLLRGNYQLEVRVWDQSGELTVTSSTVQIR